MAIISTTDCKTTIVTVARFSFLLVGIASTAIIIASIMIPISTSLISTSLPQIRIIASTFLSPSHLFITVHFIIIAIWKLNKNNTHIHQPLHQKPQYQQQEEDEEIQFQIKPPEIPCDVLPPDPISTAVEEPDDTMDATWKTIVESDAAAAAGGGDGGGAAATTELARRKMRKSETWERCNNRECSPAAAAAEGRFRKSKTFRRASVGRDELFGRAEAFIRTHYEQRRIQRQESEQRYVEMVNAAC